MEGGEVDILAPYDGLINRIVVKQGDQVQEGASMAVLQKNNYYTDLYILHGYYHCTASVYLFVAIGYKLWRVRQI